MKRLNIDLPQLEERKGQWRENEDIKGRGLDLNGVNLWTGGWDVQDINS